MASVTAATPVRVLSHAARAAIDEYLHDGLPRCLFGWRWFSVGPGENGCRNYIGPAGLGLADNGGMVRGGFRAGAVSGVPEVDYVGVVHAIKNPVDGSLLGIVHLETHAGGVSVQFWSQTGLARSVDGGYSWTYLGAIISAGIAYNPDATYGVPSGGLPMVRVGDHLIACLRDQGTGDVADRRLTPVRADADAVFEAAAAGSVGDSLWKKYDGSGFTIDAVTPGTVGADYPTPMVDTYMDVQYHSTSGLYLMAYMATHTVTWDTIGIRTSTDAMTWVDHGPVTPPETLGGTPRAFYPGLVMRDSDGLGGSGNVWIYWVGGTRWTNIESKSALLTITP